MQRIRRSLIAKAAGLVAVMNAYILFITRRAMRRTLGSPMAHCPKGT